MIRTPQKPLPARFHRDQGDDAFNLTERRALSLLRMGPLTRAQIARGLDLSGMSGTRLADSLIKRGFVEEIGRIGESKGPSIGLALVPSAAYSIGIAVMTDALSLALMDLSGAVLAQQTIAQVDMRRDVALDTLSRAISHLIEAHCPSPDHVFGYGIAVSGFFTGDGTQMNPPAALEDWALMDLEPLFEARFDRPVWVDNDGNAAAVGEALFGVGQWANSFAYLYFAGGFGGGMIQDGQLLRGRYGNAGEFSGAIPITGFERPTLELLRQIVSEEDQPFDNLNDLLDHFDPTWSGVERWLNRVMPAFDVAVSAASGVVDPDAIVLGGRLPPALGAMMIERVQFFSLPRRGIIRPVPKIVMSETSGDATSLGAAAMPFKSVFFS
ncbi:ROK family transcriptional regulator [Woodsholea maritima]|uniref:ROK family transcriptional regulator n=1 Tax=Woodsholea maritima TaxID=240237 RepID=UPI00039F898E|nr:ROK family transcriptional regulator [Woodsholea maritima]